MAKDKKTSAPILFQQKKIRRQWVAKEEKWYFSVIDVISALTESKRPRKYWNDLKKKLTQEGSQLSDKIGQLKMLATDGKYYKTDVLATEDLLRLVQSIPSPKAEPFKLWLARIGYERLEETADPEKAINRALETYLRKGYSPNWINQRLKSIEVRKALTDEWHDKGVKRSIEFAILTNDVLKTWSDHSVKEYKELKNLKKENLRDHMTDLELILNMLAEASTTEISKIKNPRSFRENRVVAKSGAKVAKKARNEIESKTGKNVVNHQNYLDLKNKQKPTSSHFLQ